MFLVHHQLSLGKLVWKDKTLKSNTSLYCLVSTVWHRTTREAGFVQRTVKKTHPPSFSGDDDYDEDENDD